MCTAGEASPSYAASLHALHEAFFSGGVEPERGRLGLVGQNSNVHEGTLRSLQPQGTSEVETSGEVEFDGS